MGRRIALILCVGAILTLAGAGCVAAQPEGSVQAAPPSGAPAEPPPPGPGGVPDGEWVYTQQYGWVWMTYGDEYAYVPPDGTGEPLEYVYYPFYGWAWIAAPWVWGIGPWPHFGARGPEHFAWYSHGYWRRPSSWQYRPVPERGGVASGVRPAPIRPGSAPRQGRPPARSGGEERRDRGERGGRGDGGRGDGGNREGGAPPPRR